MQYDIVPMTRETVGVAITVDNARTRYQIAKWQANNRKELIKPHLCPRQALGRNCEKCEK